MRKITLFLLSWWFAILPVQPTENQVNNALLRLDKELLKRDCYESQKREQIDSLKHLLPLSTTPYSIYKDLYEEYRSYNYDTALIYILSMEQEALRLSDQKLFVETQISKAFVFLSGGLFHEAYESLSSIQDSSSDLPDNYYMTFARLLYDMSDYSGETYLADEYNSRGNEYMSVLVSRHTPADSAQFWYPLAVIDLRNGNFAQSIIRLQEAMLDSRITDHDRAVYTSSLGYLFRLIGDTELSLTQYINAAIYDILSCTHETVALRAVAEILYEKDEIPLADKYIHLAMDDAKRYHARHRQVSVSQLLPIIEVHQTARLKRRTFTALVLLSGVLCLLVFFIVGIILLLHRNRTISEAHRTIDMMNSELAIANQVKEEILCNFLAGNSQFLRLLEQYQKHTKEAAINRRYAELMTLPKNIDAHARRIQLNRNLDEVLLRIFPHFVEKFNALLTPEGRIEPKPDELLTPALRIFALIRLGIVHNEIIAEILDYSVNTVYTYKTRTINNSPLSSEQFYAALHQIN